MNAIRDLKGRIVAILVCGLLALGLTGCATNTGVSRNTTLEPEEGLVALRVIDISDLPITEVIVRSQTTNKEYYLYRRPFGQKNVFGRLPAGRYQPIRMYAYRKYGGYSRMVNVPLTKRTGTFDVEPGRVTQLGTLIYLKIEGTEQDGSFKFLAALDPTPVAVEDLLAARYPQLSKSLAGKPMLGWVAGTVPKPPRADWLDLVRQLVPAARQPTFINANTQLSGGPLGVVSQWRPSSRPTVTAAPTVHTVSALQVLKDGRWLIGGEEGYLAISANAGKNWQSLPPLKAEDMVLQFAQYEDGRVLVVADRDAEVVIYESLPNLAGWKELRRIPSDRGDTLHVDYAAVTKERLLIFTRPTTLSILDLRTGRWESVNTPAKFDDGIKVAPDGYLVGMGGDGAWRAIWGSEDYGVNWKRLEHWTWMSQPHFLDRRRGIVIAKSQTEGTFWVRTTKDGGLTWTVGSRSSLGFNAMQPLWSDPSGSTLFTETDNGVLVSKDQGQTWN